MSAHMLTQENLAALVGELLDGGTRVAAPARPAAGPPGRSPVAPTDEVDYRWITDPAEIILGRGLPRRSLKELFLPATEALLRWKQLKGTVEIEEIPTEFGPRVILGARPCDAAALEVVDRVMGWDYRDELWFGRRQATTIVALACPGVDASCFCAALGLAPDATRGADVMLVPVQGGYAVQT
ncbi:MAG: hypothetical protein FJ125_17735, partial [Deltaproteobacteria bacterium]|nr:hypothetical protein [Deltaproteobacteria bacterium]